MASTLDAEDVEVSRTRLCEEFAGVTGTDCGVAQCYLAENDWNVQVCYTLGFGDSDFVSNLSLEVSEVCILPIFCHASMNILMSAVKLSFVARHVL